MLKLAHLLDCLVVFIDAKAVVEELDFLSELVWSLDWYHVDLLRVLWRDYSKVEVLLLGAVCRLRGEIGGGVVDVFVAALDDALVSVQAWEVEHIIWVLLLFLLFNGELHVFQIFVRLHSGWKRGKNGLSERIVVLVISNS